jgi:hypothetical protein
MVNLLDLDHLLSFLNQPLRGSMVINKERFPLA